MRLGVTLPHFRDLASGDAVRKIALHAEQIGLDSVWVTDHVVISDEDVPRFGETFYEPIAVLSAVSAMTSRLQLGTSALILPYRNPVVTAKQLSTIDAMSGGRLIFGAASGWAEAEFAALGVDFADRGALSDEYLRVIRTLWLEERPSFQGRWFRFSNLRFRPRPVQAPHPPIWIGGNSRRGIRRAVELGDCWHPTRPRLADIRNGKAGIAEEAERAGRDPATITVAAREPFLVDEGRRADASRPFMGPRAHVEESMAAFAAEGVEHMVIDLFYSTSALHNATLGSMMRSMESLVSMRPGADEDSR